MAHPLRITGIIALAATAACSPSTDLTAPTKGSQVFGRADVTAAATNNVVVTESDIARQPENTFPTRNWVYYYRSVTSTGDFVTGPDNPPLGVGSFLLKTPTGADKGTLFNYDHVGTWLADIDAISYATYRDPSSLVTSPFFQLPSINIEIDPDGPTGPLGYTSIVYEPVYNLDDGLVQTGVWQSWNAVEGIWWTTRPINGPLGAGTCLPTVCYISWSDIVQYNPNAVILAGFGVNQGSGSGGLVAATDALTIGYNGNSWTYNFEPFRSPSNKDDCKDGGWETMRKADGSPFKNQGECIKYTRENSGGPPEET